MPTSSRIPTLEPQNESCPNHDVVMHVDGGRSTEIGSAGIEIPSLHAQRERHRGKVKVNSGSGIECATVAAGRRGNKRRAYRPIVVGVGRITGIETGKPAANRNPGAER